MVQFKGNDATLKYGVLVFYDTVAAASFVRERKTIGQIQSVSAVLSGTPNVFTSDTVKFDIIKGQYIYVIPFAYKKEGGDPGITNDYSKVFSSRGYIQLKISPRTYFTDIPSSSNSPVIFQGNNKLSYLESIGGNIFCKEYDETNQKWMTIGSTPSSFTALPVRTDVLFTRNISPTDWIFYKNEKYYMISTIGVTAKPSSETVLASTFSSEGSYGQSWISIITLDKSFKSENLVDVSQSTSNNDTPIVKLANYFSSANTNNDTLRIFYNTSLYNFQYSGSSVKSGLANYPIGSTQTTDYTNLTYGFGPSISLFINNKILLNDRLQQTNFVIFLFTKNGIGVETKSQIYPGAFYALLQNPDVAQVASGKGFISLSDGTQGYVIGPNQIIYKVTSVGNNPNFSVLYSGWFPVNGFTSIRKSIMYKNQFAFLLNNNEIWLFNPNEVSIEFDPKIRPGAFKIVSL